MKTHDIFFLFIFCYTWHPDPQLESPCGKLHEITFFMTEHGFLVCAFYVFIMSSSVVDGLMCAARSEAMKKPFINTLRDGI